MRPVLVVLSGGQDSTTCLFLARQRASTIHAITFDYGQRHKIEIEAAKAVGRLANVASHEVITIGPELMRSTSPLTSDATLEQYKDAAQMDEVIGSRIEKTFVPMRNTLFLTIAANRAVHHGARMIYTGICASDNANYPDCTLAFKYRMEELVNESLGLKEGAEQLNLVCPLLHMDKRQSVLLAHSMPDLWYALAYTHTSYDGTYPPVDMNHANVLRAEGFEKANLPDPLVLRAWREGKMQLPATSNYVMPLVENELRLMKRFV